MSYQRTREGATMKHDFSNYETECFYHWLDNPTVNEFKSGWKRRTVEEVAAKLKRHVELCIKNFKPCFKNDLLAHSLKKIDFMEVAAAIKADIK